MSRRRFVAQLAASGGACALAGGASLGAGPFEDPFAPGSALRVEEGGLIPTPARWWKALPDGLHPGILPENRGLDNMKWAIKKGIPQGVTAHWIDEHIDAGWIIRRERIPIYEEDTLIECSSGFRIKR